MIRPVRLLNLGTIPAGLTQAIYHALAERMDEDEQDTIIFCQPDSPYLCLGFHQVLESVFDRKACAERGLPIYRRQIGGGATYLDSDQIFYQCIFYHNRMPLMLKDIYQFALSAPVATLRQSGLAAELVETNEIEVGSKRVAGTGGGRIGEATVVVGNLLFNFDFDAMAAVWRTPNESFRYLAQKALHESLSLLVESPCKAGLKEVTQQLIENYRAFIRRPCEFGKLSPDEMAASEVKAKELFCMDHPASPAPGAALMKELKISARSYIRYEEIQTGHNSLRGNFWVQENIIREALLESSPGRNWHFLEQKLKGTPYSSWKELFFGHEVF